MMSWLDLLRRQFAARLSAARAGSDPSGTSGSEPSGDAGNADQPDASPDHSSADSSADGGKPGDQAGGTPQTTPSAPREAVTTPSEAVTTPGQAAAPGRTTSATSGPEEPPPAEPPPEPPAEPSAPMRLAPSLEHVGMFTWVRIGFLVALGGVAAVGLTNAAQAASAILVQTLIALFLAVSLDPMVRALNRRGLPRPLAVIVIFTAFVTLISLFLLSVIPPLVNQVNEFAEDVPVYVANLQEQSVRFEDLNEQFQITERLQEFAATLPANIAGSLVEIVLWIFTAVGSTVLVVVLTIYFLLDLPRIRRGAPRLLPLRTRERFEGIVDVVVDKVGAYMIGQFAISLIAGVTAFVALTVVGSTAPLPLAIVVAVTAIIPLVGATLGAIVSVVVTAFTNELWPTAVVLLGFFIVYQQVENYFISPRVQRSAVDLSAPAVLLAGIVGAAIQGLLGALMAIPLAAAIKVVIMERIEEHERGDGPPRPNRSPRLTSKRSPRRQ